MPTFDPIHHPKKRCAHRGILVAAICGLLGCAETPPPEPVPTGVEISTFAAAPEEPEPAPTPTPASERLAEAAEQLETMPDIAPTVHREVWEAFRAKVPGIELYRSTPANPVEVARQFLVAVAHEDLELLLHVLHPQAAFPMPPIETTGENGQFRATPLWDKFWAWQRFLVGIPVGAIGWGAPVVANGPATVVVALAPGENEVWVPTVLLGYIEDARLATSNSPRGRWAVIGVRRQLPPDAEFATAPLIAKFDPPVMRHFQIRERDPAIASVGEWKLKAATDAALKALFDVATSRGAKALTSRISDWHATIDEEKLGLEPPFAPGILAADTLADRVAHAVADAPTLIGTHMLTWFVPITRQAVVVEMLVAMDGGIGPPRFYRASWVAPADVMAITKNGIAPPEAAEDWLLLDWQRALTHGTLDSLGFTAGD